MFKLTNQHLFSLFIVATILLSVISEARTAPTFFLPEIDNEKTLVSMKEQRGKVVYLDFWASWCGPCRQSFPKMEKLYQQYKDQGLEIITINLDERPELGKSFLDSLDVSFITLYDRDKLLPNWYQVQAMPTSFLIDKNGEIRFQHKGFKKSDLPKLEEQLQSLLSE